MSDVLYCPHCNEKVVNIWDNSSSNVMIGFYYDNTFVKSTCKYCEKEYEIKVKIIIKNSTYNKKQNKGKNNE